MANKLHQDDRHCIEYLRYRPLLQDSGDIEGSTRNINVTSKQPVPDYSISLTTPASPDSRLVVKKLGQRFQVRIDSFGGAPAATTLYYSVEGNGVERASGSFTSAGDRPRAWNLGNGQFNLGTPNNIFLYLWVDRGNALISLCQFWQAVGTTGVIYPHSVDGTVATIKHSGGVIPQAMLRIIGTGIPNLIICNTDIGSAEETYIKKVSGDYSNLYYEGNTIVQNELALRTYGGVQDDLSFLYAMSCVIVTM